MIALLLIAAGTQTKLPPAEFPFPSVTFGREGVVDFEVAIVRSVKRLGYEEREYKHEDSRQTKVLVALDEAVVTDSTTNLGRNVVIATPFYAAYETQFQAHSRELRKLPSGAQLIFYTESRDELHRQPNEGFESYRMGKSFEHPYARISKGMRPGEILGQAAYNTKATRILEKGAEPIDRLQLNLAEAIRGANLESIQRICHVFEYSNQRRFHYLGPTNDRNIDWVTESPCVRRMREIMPGLNPSNRARVAMILFMWNVKGASHDLLRAIKAANNDPKLFNTDGDTYIGGKLLDGEAILDGAKTQEQREKKLEEFFEMAFATKSPGLRWLLICNCGWTPSNAGQRKALGLAASASDDEASLILSRLALWNDDEENVPKFEVTRTGRIFVNRGTLIEHWKNILGI